MISRFTSALLVLVLASPALAAELSVTKVRLRLNSSGQGDNSAVKVKGDFIIAPPGDVVAAHEGIRLRIQDGLGLDVAYDWAGWECATLPGAKCSASRSTTPSS